MVIPSKENKNATDLKMTPEDFSNKPKTYYEIGCKIFEINKIYK